jgi:hypothetical protein
MRPIGPSGSQTSWSIRPPRAPDLPFADRRLAGVRSRRYREVAAGGAEPTRESCRGRHAQAPGPRQVRRPEHDADETPDTCSSRSLAPERFSGAAHQGPKIRRAFRPAHAVRERVGTTRCARGRSPHRSPLPRRRTARSAWGWHQPPTAPGSPFRH